MGQFSWLDCVTQEQILDNVVRTSYVLVPKEFVNEYGGSYISERCYDGYGHFGCYDIYDLVAEWNRDYLDESMLEPPSPLERYGGFYDFEKEKLRKEGKSEEEIKKLEDEKRRKYYEMGLERYQYSVDRLNDYKNRKYDDDEMFEIYGIDWKREIGIDIACYDEQNEKLPFPIKITHKADVAYENCGISLGDENQGWPVEDDDEDEEW